MTPSSVHPPAVVVGLDCITGLQTARILARRGVPVIGVAADLRHFCCRTRVCRRIVRAETASDELVTTLERLGTELGRKAVLVPCTDASVLQLSRHRERLEPWFHVALPAADVVDTLLDKVAFSAHAAERGLPVPRTLLLHDRAEAREAAGSLSFPCVLKPPVKTAAWEEHADAKVYKVEGGQELLEVYDRVAPWTEVLLVQEWIEGGEDELYSCNGYFDAAGRPVATFVARKLRQWPPHTGTSSLGEECRNDEVLEVALRLFRDVRFHGLGYLEMKRDARTGRQLVVEANVGRPTGRSAIAEAGGVELLYAMYCDLVGLPLPEGLEQRYTGVKWIYWRADLQASLVGWRNGELTPLAWWRSIRGRRQDAVLAWTDPLPFLLDVAQVPRLALRRLRARRRRRAGGDSGAVASLPRQSHGP